MSAVLIEENSGEFHVKVQVERLGADAAEQARAELLTGIPEEAGSVIVDMEKVTFADSSGIGCLIFLKKRLKPEAKVRLVNVQSSMNRIFNLVKLAEVLEIG